MTKRLNYFQYNRKLESSYKQLKKVYKEAKNSYSEMIFRLDLVVEYRDEATGAHLVKIADYSTEIGKGFGISAKDIENLRYASPTHGIGKLILPRCNHKKGSRSKLLKVVKTVILTHHERYNGTGYPKGLKGEEIPIYGRVVVLADFFDAVTFDRPYRKGYSFDKAIALIEEGCGSYFDPAIVKAFLKRKSRRGLAGKSGH